MTVSMCGGSTFSSWQRQGLWLALLLFLTCGFTIQYEGGPVENAATLPGVVKFEGEPPSPLRFKVTMGADPEYCQQVADKNGWIILPQVRVSSNHELAEVVVFLQEVERGKPFSSERPVLTIEGCLFQPFVSAAGYGHSVRITMHDTILHQIRGWEMLSMGRLPLFHYPGIHKGEERIGELRTRKSSIVKFECDQHRFMQSWLLVTANPYFTVTGDTGRFHIQEIPPGIHTVGAWHPILGYQEATVILLPGEQENVTFTFAPPSP